MIRQVCGIVNQECQLIDYLRATRAAQRRFGKLVKSNWPDSDLERTTDVGVAVVSDE